MIRSRLSLRPSSVVIPTSPDTLKRLEETIARKVLWDHRFREMEQRKINKMNQTRSMAS
jgi:hypothetical protein